MDKIAYRIAILLSCLATASAACTKSHTARLEPHRFANQKLTVRMHTGHSQQVHTTIRGGVVVWVNERGQVVPTKEVASAEKVNRGRGFLQGLGLGLLTGAGLGATIGLLDGDDPECGNDEWVCIRLSAGDKAVLGGAFFGCVGAALGGLIGLISGSRDTYEAPTEMSAMPQVGFRPVAGGGTTSLSWRF